MRYLIDTHTLLWFLADAPELSPKAKATLLDEANQIVVSVASFWEIAIKNSLGKLELKVDYEELLRETERNGFELLTISFDHTVLLNKLPFHHRDPFDRMIIAQSIVESINLVGVDKVFDEYFTSSQIKRIW